MTPSGLQWEGFAGSLLQALVLAAGALWAYRLYRKRREFKPKVRVEMAGRISSGEDGQGRVFIRLHVVNQSGTLIKMNARVVLWSVKISANHRPEFTELARDFPLDYIYGEVKHDRIMADDDGSPVDNCDMEPLECFETELIFPIDPLPDLLGVRASIQQDVFRRNRPKFLVKEVFDVFTWETFAYLEPSVMGGNEYVSLTSHSGDHE